MTRRTMPVEISPRKTALIATIFLRLSQKSSNLLRNARRLRGPLLPNRLQCRVLRKHFLDGRAQWRGGAQAGCDGGENQALQLVEVAKFGLPHQFSQYRVSIVGSD